MNILHRYNTNMHEITLLIINSNTRSQTPNGLKSRRHTLNRILSGCHSAFPCMVLGTIKENGELRSTRNPQTWFSYFFWEEDNVYILYKELKMLTNGLSVNDGLPYLNNALDCTEDFSLSSFIRTVSAICIWKLVAIFFFPILSQLVFIPSQTTSKSKNSSSFLMTTY